MKLKTTRFGEIDISEEEILNFPEGILGFEEVRKYVLIPMEEGNPLMWMQSVDEPSLAFVVISPFEFRPNYSINLSDKDVQFLDLKEPQDAEIFAIVVIPEDSSRMTANLQGPIVINKSEKVGKQIISGNPKHKIRHYILDEMRELAKGGN